MVTLSKDTTVVICKYDGMEYPIDLADLSGREMGVVKKYTDIRGLNQFRPAFRAGDLQLMAVLVGLAMERSGIKADYEKLLSIPNDQFDLRDEEENDPTEAGETPAEDGKQSTQESTT